MRRINLRRIGSEGIDRAGASSELENLYSAHHK